MRMRGCSKGRAGRGAQGTRSYTPDFQAMAAALSQPPTPEQRAAAERLWRVGPDLPQLPLI
jgi:hypothetical protein